MHRLDLGANKHTDISCNGNLPSWPVAGAAIGKDLRIRRSVSVVDDYNLTL